MLFGVGSMLMTVAGPTNFAHADSVVLIEGRGFGHGVGLAQDGAYWMGRSGRTATEILRLFFPNTTLAKRGGIVRVPLATQNVITLRFDDGGLVGTLRIPAGGSITVNASGGIATASVNAQSAATPVNKRADSILSESRESRESKTVEGTQVVERHSGTGHDIGPGGAKSFLRPGETPTRQLLRTQIIDPIAPTTVAPVPTLVPLPPTPSTTVAPVIDGEPQDPTASTAPVPAPVAPTGAVPNDPAASVAEPNATVATSVVTPAADATAPVSGDQPSGTQPAKKKGVTESGAILEAKARTTIAVGGRKYRGTIEFRASGSSLRVVNAVDLEDYLKGMGEILTPQWPSAALEAQAIAARTYALRTMAISGEVCPTQRCQVYLGAQAEYPKMNQAVEATRGKVLVHEGKLIAAFYSASGGGTIATPEEAFGGKGDVAYLQAGAYPTGDVLAWTVRTSLGDIARRVGYRGSPSRVWISKVGPSGRAIEVSVEGGSGTLHIPGPRFDKALGLKSTFFTFGSNPLSNPLTPPATSNVPPPAGEAVPGLPGLSSSSASNLPDTADASLDAQSDLLQSADPSIDAVAPTLPPPTTIVAGGVGVGAGSGQETIVTPQTSTTISPPTTSPIVTTIARTTTAKPTTSTTRSTKPDQIALGAPNDDTSSSSGLLTGVLIGGPVALLGALAFFLNRKLPTLLRKTTAPGPGNDSTQRRPRARRPTKRPPQ